MNENTVAFSGKAFYHAIRITLWWQWLLILVSLIAYGWLAYFIPRTATFELLLCYGVLYLAYLALYRDTDSKQVYLFLGLAVVFRLVWFAAIPALSDDFYRFIWDGKLMAHGLNPFTATPEQLMQAGNLDHYNLTIELYQNLNSPRYFTIYPPLNQVVFWLAAELFPRSAWGSVMVMRFFILLAELGSLLLLPRLLKLNQLPSKYALLYALNPLVIAELTGNLHFEAMMIFFLLLAIYFWQKQKVFTSGVMLGFSVAAKLLPLMLLPLWLGRLSWKKLLLFYLANGITCFLLFSYLLDADFLRGMQSSLGLYFSKFEFNASIYYLIRQVGFWIKGYNIIEMVGRYLALSVVLFIAFMCLWQHYRQLSIWQAMLWVWFFYLLMATIVHPWYLAPLLVISVFTRFRFVVLWSFLIFFTYINYQADGYKENLWVVALEYVAVLVFLFYELVGKRKIKVSERLS